MQYKVKGTLRIKIFKIIEVEVDEVVEEKYIVDALDTVTDSSLAEIEGAYPDYTVELYTNKSVGVTKV